MRLSVCISFKITSSDQKGIQLVQLSKVKNSFSKKQKPIRLDLGIHVEKKIWDVFHLSEADVWGNDLYYQFAHSQER